MKKLVTLITLSMTAVAVLLGSQAYALAPFKKAFQVKYVDKAGDDMKAAFKKSSCNTCHVKGQKKTARNEYGDELAKLIEGDANARLKAARKEGGSAGQKAETAVVLEELDKAFDQVAKMKNKAGDVYGDRLEAGQLPIE